MAHTLIVGTTECGKGLLAKDIVKRYAAAGYVVLVLDPTLSVWPGSYFVTDDPEFFLEEAKKWRECLLVLDEAGESVGRFAGEMKFVATRFRHLKHSAIFIVQKPGLLDSAVRDNCRYLALFNVSAYDSKKLADDFPAGGLRRAATLPQFHYLWASRFGGEATLGRVNTPWLSLSEEGGEEGEGPLSRENFDDEEKILDEDTEVCYVGDDVT